jgi:spore coat polysaccharide biosynthesis predicted glycosyltransferase SpsG
VSAVRRILFRADADPAVGTGDLASLAGLAASFDPARYEAHFMVRRHAYAEGLAAARGLARVHWLAPDLDLAGEVAAVNQAVDGLGLAALVFEITRVPLDSYPAFTDRAVRACVCFDSRVPRDFDVVVDWDVSGPRAFAGLEFPRAELLLGPGYVLLPPHFDLERAARVERARPRRRVLVAMGGADEHDLTARACAALAGLGRELELTVVLGPGYRQEERLRARLAASGLTHRVERNVPDMFARYLECDFAVGTGGLTVSELAATRTPAAVVAAYAHQVERCEFFAAMGAVRYLGFGALDPAALAAALDGDYTLAPVGFFRPQAVREAVERAIARREPWIS